MLIMIARRGNSEKDIKALFLMNENYEIKEVTIDKLIQTFKTKKGFKIENVGYNPKTGLEYTNGAASSYTLYSTDGNIINSPRNVILNRIEVNNKLQGYTIYNYDNTLSEISVEQAARFAAAKLIANGKIRHTQQGDIVSSIGGDYPIREVKIDSIKEVGRTIIPLYFASFVSASNSGKTVDYVGAIVETNSGAVMSKVVTASKQMNEALLKELKAERGNSKYSFDELGNRTIGATSAFIVVGLDDMKKLLGNGLKKHKSTKYRLSVTKLDGNELIETRADASLDGAIGDITGIDELRGVIRELNDKAKGLAAQMIEK